MPSVNFWAVFVSVVVMFMLSSFYYSLFGEQLARLRGTADTAFPLWKVPLELLRSLVVALVLATLLGLTGDLALGGTIGLALLLWLGFPVVLLAGSVLHENVPWRLAALHAGDWLIKLGVVALILELWR